MSENWVNITYAKDVNVKVARISHHTGQVEVCPDFFSFDQEVQEFILTDLQFYKESKDWYSSDKNALQHVRQRHPEKSNDYWKKEIGKIFDRNDSEEAKERYRRLFPQAARNQ